MFPTLFKISFMEARSYYVLWAFALLIFIFWTRRRAETLYDIDYDDVSSVLIWVYCAGILGSYAASVLTRLPLYFRGEIQLSLALKGMTSWGGMLAGGLAGLLRLRMLKIKVNAFADASALPCAALLAVGRLGCFMEGCCAGVGHFYAKAPWWGLHFPFDPAGYWHFPSQELESLASFSTLAVLCCVQYALTRHGRLKDGGVLFPLFLILYGAYRFLSDPMREADPAGVGQPVFAVWAAAIVTGAAWLALTYFQNRIKSGTRV